MRPAAFLLFLLALATLAVAAFAGNPTWRIALFASTFLFTLLALAAAAALIEAVRPAAARTGWAALGLTAEVAAAVISRLLPLGSLPERPLLDLSRSGVSVLGLGLWVGGFALAALGWRSPSRWAGAWSALAALGALFAMGPWLARL